MKEKIRAVFLYCSLITMAVIAASCSLQPAGGNSSPVRDTISGELLSDTNTTIKTIMVYLDGDNNLEQYALQNFNEMEAGLNNPDLNVIVLFDRAPGHDTSDGDWTGTRLYKIVHDPNGADNTIRSTRLGGLINGVNLTTSGDSEELNMADPQTLSGFVDYVRANYPSEGYMLILWNHGGGWRSRTGSVNTTGSFLLNTSSEAELTGQFTNINGKKAILKKSPSAIMNNPYPVQTEKSASDITKEVCWDETSGNDVLYNSEVRTALTGKGIKIIGFDACLMGMAETAYELRNTADYLIASPEVELAGGWSYSDWLSQYSQSKMTAPDLILNIIDSYSRRYVSTRGATLAAYKLSRMDSIMAAFNSYVSDLSNYLWNTGHINRKPALWNTIVNSVEQYIDTEAGGYFHLDIYDLAQKISISSNSEMLKSAVKNAVVYEWHNPSGDIFSGNPYSSGMAVYAGTFASSSSISCRVDYIYSNFTLFNIDSSWDSFLLDYYLFPPEIWTGTNSIQSSFLLEESNAFYQFYVETPGLLSIDLWNYGTNDFDLYLFDPDNIIVGYSASSNQSEHIGFNAEKTGWHIVCVNAFSGSSSYSMVVSNQGAGIR